MATDHTQGKKERCPHGGLVGWCSWCDLRDDGGLPESQTSPPPEPEPAMEKFESLEYLKDLSADLSSVTWLAPVTAQEMNTRDRWLSGEMEKIAEALASQQQDIARLTAELVAANRDAKSSRLEAMDWQLRAEAAEAQLTDLREDKDRLVHAALGIEGRLLALQSALTRVVEEMRMAARNNASSGHDDFCDGYSSACAFYAARVSTAASPRQEQE